MTMVKVKKAANAKKMTVNALKARFVPVLENGEKIAKTLKAAKAVAVEAARVEAVLRALPNKDISATTMVELEMFAENDATIAAVVNMAKAMPIKGGDGLVRDDDLVRGFGNLKTLEVLKKAIAAVKKAVNTVCRDAAIEKIQKISEIEDGDELLRTVISESGVIFPSKMTWEELTQPIEDIKSVKLCKINETKVEVKKAVTTTDNNEDEEEQPVKHRAPLVTCRKEKASVTADSIIKKMEPVAEEYIAAVNELTTAMSSLSAAITAAADIAAELGNNDDINDDGNDDDNNNGVDVDEEISGLIDNIDTAISLLPEMSESDNVTIKQIGEDRLENIAKEVVEKLVKAGELHEETLQHFIEVGDEILDFCLRAVLKADVSGEETGKNDIVIPDTGDIGAGNCYDEEDNNNNNNNDNNEPLDFNGVTPNELVATEGFKPLVVIREVIGKWYITTTPYGNGIVAIWERESANAWRRYFVKFEGALINIATADEKSVADGIDEMLFVNHYAGKSKENGLSEVFSELAVCEFMTGYQKKPETEVATLDVSDPLVAAIAAVYPDEEIVVPRKYASASVVSNYNAVIAERQSFLEKVAVTTVAVIGNETQAIEVWKSLAAKLHDDIASDIRVEDGEILVEDFDPFDNTTFGTTYRLTANGFELY